MLSKQRSFARFHLGVASMMAVYSASVNAQVSTPPSTIVSPSSNRILSLPGSLIFSGS